MVNRVEEHTMPLEHRIAALEARTSALEELIHTREPARRSARGRLQLHRPARRGAIAAPATAPNGPSSPAGATAPGGPSSPAGATGPGAARAPRRDLEDVFGGSALAWLGGIAVVAGLAFLLTIAVSRGWIGEGARTALAGAVSLGLLAGGVWLRERRGRNVAAVAAAAAGVAGAFGTLVVAGPVYSLVPDAPALLGALAVGGAATGLAVRWRAPAMAWIGLCGALLAPAVLAGGAALPYLAVAYAATVAVLVWQRWPALAFTGFGLAAVQWMAWLGRGHAPTAAIAVAAVFGALTIVAAVGFELRRRAPHVRRSAVALLVLNALAVDAAGWWGLHDTSLPAANGLLVAVAAAHLAVGLAGTRLPRVSRELALIALGLGVVLADVAYAALTSGLPLVLGWVAGTIGFGILLRHRRPATYGSLGRRRPPATNGSLWRRRPPATNGFLPRRRPPATNGSPARLRPGAATGDIGRADRVFALAGLGGHLLSALAHALVIDAPLIGGSPGSTGVLAVAAVAAGTAVSARFADRRVRIALDGLALVLLVYVSALALDGVALTAALAGEAAALAALARRERDPVAARGAAAFAGLALLHAVAVLAPPAALLEGLARPLPAAGALVAAAAALALAARAVPRPGGGETAEEAPALAVFGGGGTAEEAPALAVFGGGETASGAPALAARAFARAERPLLRGLATLAVLYLASVEVVSAAQPALTAQTLLSVLWAIAGVGTLVAGLATERGVLRRAALVLLAVTAGKVFLYDLSALASLARVGSLMGLGGLLLAGGFAWQRFRPLPLPDLREAGSR